MGDVVRGDGARVAANARTGERWWERRAFAVLLVLAMSIPLLGPAIPPLIDLPSHMARYHILLDLSSSPFLQKYYESHWALIGNLGVDALAISLGKWIGIELATKLVVIAIPVATAAGMVWIARETHGRLPPTLAFALPLAYGYPFHFGFVNYCLGMAVMMLGLGLWLNLARSKRFALRAAAFAVIAVVTWAAHAIAWGLLCVACGAAELHRRRHDGQAWRQAVAGSAVSCATLCMPVVVMLTVAHGGHSSTTHWFELRELAKWTVTLLRDRWMAYDLAGTAVLFAVLGLAACRRFGLGLRASMVFPALAFVAIFALAPQGINDSFFVNGRIAPYAFALLLIAIGAPTATPSQQRRIAVAAVAFFVVRLIGTTASLGLYGASYAANLAALDAVRPGSAVLALSPLPCRPDWSNWSNPRLYHLSGMAVVRKDAFVNSEWQIDGLQLLNVKYAPAGAFAGDPSELVSLPGCAPGVGRPYRQQLADFPRPAFDYLWLLGVPPDLWPHEPDLRLVWSRDDAALYQVTH